MRFLDDMWPVMSVKVVRCKNRGKENLSLTSLFVKYARSEESRILLSFVAADGSRLVHDCVT
jgi:hypothetical protein